MKARVRKNNVPAAAGCWVAFKNAGNIGRNTRKHVRSVPVCGVIRVWCALRTVFLSDFMYIMAVETLEIQKFLFEDAPVRGVAVRLTHAWQEILRRKAQSEAGAYPPVVQNILGEMIAAAVLMQAHVKLDGALIMQMQNVGALRMAVAEVTANLGLRATATMAQDAAISPNACFADLAQAGSNARCAITFDPKDSKLKKQAYQGIVPLHDAQGNPSQSISSALQNYMLQSEQLHTTLVLAADEQVAAGLLIQRMPNSDNIEAAQAQYEHLSVLAHSLKTQELLSLDIPTILHRLFWNEKLLQISAEATDPTPHFSCTCSHERVANMLRGLGQEEVHEILAQKEKIEVDCSFCSQKYRFDAVDAQQLFVQSQQQAAVSERKQ